MELQTVWGILLAGLLTNNYAILNFLGIGPVMEGERTPKNSLMQGLGAAVVMLVSTLITWPLQTYVLGAVPYLQNMAFVLVILVVSWVVHQAVGHWRTPRDPAGFWKFAISGAVLGLCIQSAELSYGEALITAFAAGIGFALTAALFTKLRSRIDEDCVPAAFRGLPIDLLCAGMIALALLSF